MTTSHSEEFSAIKTRTSASTASGFCSLHSLSNVMRTEKEVQQSAGTETHFLPGSMSSSGQSFWTVSSACPIQDFSLFNLLPFFFTHNFTVQCVVCVSTDMEVCACPANFLFCPSWLEYPEIVQPVFCAPKYDSHCFVLYPFESLHLSLSESNDYWGIFSHSKDRSLV